MNKASCRHADTNDQSRLQQTYISMRNKCPRSIISCRRFLKGVLQVIFNADDEVPGGIHASSGEACQNGNLTQIFARLN